MDKKIIIADYNEAEEFSLEEVCEICHIPVHTVQDLLALEVITPRHPISRSSFNIDDLTRIQAALRLHKDLAINFEGVALVLELLDEMKELRQTIAIYDKHFKLIR